MKIGKLEEGKRLLEKEIKESGLISKCIDIALLGKMTHNKERDCSTHVVWEYGSKEKLWIRYESGIYVLGDGEKLDVYSKDEEVFKVRDNSIMKIEGYKDDCVQIGEKYVMKFVKGDWENQIDKFLIELPPNMYEEHKRNFPSLSC